VRKAEDGWNSRNPSQLALAYSIDSHWPNRFEFVTGRAEIVAFLTRKWAKELEYRLIEELCGLSTKTGLPCALLRSHSTPQGSGGDPTAMRIGKFDEMGLVKRRVASINDLPIQESERLFDWPIGRQPDDHPGLSELGL
jgi:uncharacterized protein